MERRPNLFWPMVLIGAGILWILIQTGRIPASNLWALAYVWPMILIGAGIGLILRPYWQYAGALISVLVVAGLFLSVLFAAQLGWDRVPVQVDGGWFFSVPTARGSGHVVTETRNVAGFTGVRIDYPAVVVIKQGAAESLTLEADDNIAAAIRTQVTDHVLRIDSGDRRIYITPTKPVRITITVKDLSELDFNAAGDVTVQGLHTKALKAALDGAGNIKFENLQVDTLDANLSGVGSLQASGTAQGLNIDVSGLGSFQGADLKAQTASIDLNGLGSAEVWASGTLNADINGMGSVNYFGAAQVTKSVNGLGSVNFKGAK